MGIKIGNTDISKIKIASGLTPRLPSAYQEVEYIESSGTQYINTGWYPSSNYCKVVMDGTVYSGNNSWSVFFGMTNGSNAYSLHTDHYSWQLNVGSVGNRGTGISFVSGTDGTFTFEANNGSISVDIAGSTYTGTYSGSVAQSTRPMYIFAFNENGSTTWKTNMKVRELKIYSDASTLERDFIPCYRIADGVIGLYDLVNDVFYTNAGSGTFSKGADVNLPYKGIKKVYLGSTQVRPSGWQPTANTLWYINMNQSDAVFTDTQGHTVTNNGITYNASGVSEGCGYNNSDGKRLYSDFNVGEGFPSQFTIMCFMKPTGSHYTNDHPMGISLADASTKVTWGIGFNQSNSQVQFNHLRENIAWDTSTYSYSPLNAWHHYALTYNGTTMLGYIDGVQVISRTATGSGSGTGPSGGLTVFGRNHPSYTNTIQGYVDEAICEDKVWTAQEISNYYNQTKANYGL